MQIWPYAQYAARSVSAETRHPMESLEQIQAARTLNNTELRRFEAEYDASLSYSTTRKLWAGAHRTRRVVVDLLG
jgi:hypothetical protein